MSTWASSYRILCVVAPLLLFMACAERTTQAPLSIAELRLVPRAALTHERQLDESASFTAYLVSYRYAGLRLSAMVAVPKTAMLAGGYPVVIANHGYVPEPPRYGITATGVDSRPGDYYRSVPELFASRGFLVVLPDYRGHNTSEGFEYIDPQDDRSILYYAEDVVALMSALEDVGQADLDKVFMWSHSMGGPVSLRAMLATNIVKASSFWATMNLDDQFSHLAELDGPVQIHHSVEDQSTSYSNSVEFDDALQALEHNVTMHSYDGAHHYFDAADREAAADRDAAFFLGLVTDRR